MVFGALIELRFYHHVIEKPLIITSVRNPLDHYVSYYNYFVRPQGISFSDFLARGTLKNPLATEFGTASFIILKILNFQSLSCTSMWVCGCGFGGGILWGFALLGAPYGIQGELFLIYTGVYRSVEVNMFMNTVLPQFQFIVIVEYFEECLGYSRL